ncbi:MAG: DUF502 domain-containing protein [Verrucomicrobiae bacterium]|nr:DUF502 domain-containing protein [Verrucomicrobiae bacterium]MCX7721949.1 DUF502 domain-containing protein [Verrucomicrobiae bacterium]MDW7981153.1 DUF502 domain-containing protein [Verrucomicrobiales bacterium]
MKQRFLPRLRACFVTGLAVILPAVITLAVVKWLFGTIAAFTDTLLFFLPRDITHMDGGRGPMLWYWRVVAFVLAFLLVCLAGVLTRYYMGKRFIEWFDNTMLRVPLLNKIYGTVKQVNEALTSGKKTAFKTVVLVEFPRPGLYAIGFITSEEHEEVQAKTNQKVVCVFIPTTPNPTTGFLVLVPEEKVTKLDMSVADGIKYIISLGAVAPEPAGQIPAPPANARA